VSDLMMVAGAGWTMVLGDCLDVMREMADQSVDHVITDPPYEAEAHTKQRRVTRGGVAVVQPLSFEPIGAKERIDAGVAFSRVARRWVIAFCQVEAAMKWSEAIGNYVRTCVWIKPDPMPQLTGDRPGTGYESIVVCHPPGRKRWNGGGRAGVFVANKADHASRLDGRNAHPTTKPIPLMLELVELFTDEGETVLDPFAGSGTTGCACIRLGRKFIGCEKDPVFFQLACDRLRAEEECSTLQAQRDGQLSLLAKVAT
jgi:site-specific DNA-methyltransferase (adenine-specific)